jgi:hypothetical protein
VLPSSEPDRRCGRDGVVAEGGRLRDGDQSAKRYGDGHRNSRDESDTERINSGTHIHHHLNQMLLNYHYMKYVLFGIAILPRSGELTATRVGHRGLALSASQSGK